MKYLKYIAILSILQCTKPTSPDLPNFVGEWIGTYSSVDTTWAWGKVGGVVVKAYLPYHIQKKVYYRFDCDRSWAGCAEVYSYGSKLDGWIGVFEPWERYIVVVWHGRWCSISSDMLRLEVESVESKGKWDVKPGREYTVRWSIKNDNDVRYLILRWRGEDFLFDEGPVSTLVDIKHYNGPTWYLISTTKVAP